MCVSVGTCMSQPVCERGCMCVTACMWVWVHVCHSLYVEIGDNHRCWFSHSMSRQGILVTAVHMRLAVFWEFSCLHLHLSPLGHIHVTTSYIHATRSGFTSGLWGSELKPQIFAQQAGTLSTKPPPPPRNSMSFIFDCFILDWP